MLLSNGRNANVKEIDCIQKFKCFIPNVGIHVATSRKRVKIFTYFILASNKKQRREIWYVMVKIPDSEVSNSNASYKTICISLYLVAFSCNYW